MFTFSFLRQLHPPHLSRLFIPLLVLFGKDLHAATLTLSTTTNAPWITRASEPPGPSSRNTGIALTEIMYRPAPGPAGSTNSYEFVELYNSNPFFEDLSGYSLQGDIQFSFPNNTILQGFEYIVVARDPQFFKAQNPSLRVLGPYQGSLAAQGTVRLQDRIRAVMLEVEYSNQPPWPAAADGTGHSLVLARPSQGEGSPLAWSISSKKGGSPGQADPATLDPLQNVVINEFLASSTSTNTDFIELFNRSHDPVDISGCGLSDQPTSTRYRIPSNTILPPGGHISFSSTQLNFALEASGETIYFTNPDQSRVLDCVRFDAQLLNVSSGRHPDGGTEFYPLQTPSPAEPNQEILIHDIVINEIMYSPISENDDDGFVELHNRSSSTIDLSNWRFVSGISFKFPPGSKIEPHGYLVIARNKQRLLSRYPGDLTEETVLGNYDGKPTRDGRRLALAMEQIQTLRNPDGSVLVKTSYPVVDEVTFGLGGRWGEWANGGGSSLELRDPFSNHRLAVNWGDSDETKKAPWTSLEATGLIDNSRPYNRSPINRLELTMLGTAECLVDDVEVFAGSNTVNRVSNSGFESGLTPWVPQGNHVRSTLESNNGYQSSKSLHIRSSARGDTGANRIRVALAPDLNTNQICTIRAKVRWLRGWPELVLRLKGNGFELPGILNLPTALGTPGHRNSQAISNAPPALYAVEHQPTLPAAQQPILVTAHAHDVDHLSSIKLHYRIDPSSQTTTVPMNDEGRDGDYLAADGIYTATIPGQSTDSLIAFYVEASDATPQANTSIFPDDAPTRECLIHVGEPDNPSRFGAYRFWMTARNLSNWINRPSISNERVEGTFVYGNFRTIYNMSGKYSGSPYHQGITSPKNAGCNYSLEMPLDDTLLGTENFNKIHAPGNGPFDDPTAQAEQTAYWILQQMDLPYNYRRLIEFYFNGVRKGDAFMEDTQTPGSDVLRQRFPDDKDGQLYKLQPWFEFDEVTTTGSAGAGFDTVVMCQLMNFYTGPNNSTKKLARYRYNWLTRAANLTAHNYTNVWDLTDAANTPSRGDYVSNMKHLVDLEEWMGVFAVQHSVGNWDSFGNSNAQNMYGYKPTRGKWTLLTWDFNIALGNQGSDGPTGDNLFKTNTDDLGMVRLYETPEFRRMYLRALKRIADGPMNGNALANLVDAKYAQMLTSSTNVSSPAPLKKYAELRRNYLLAEVNKYDTNFNVFGSASYSTNSDTATLTGSAPLEVKTITVNGVQYPLTWFSPNTRLTDPSYVTSWRIPVPLTPGSNTLVIQAFNLQGEPIPSLTQTISIQRTSPIRDPRGVVVFNEIQYQPAFPSASFIEILNTSTNDSFDLSQWRVDGLGYTFPTGSQLLRGQYLVLANNRSALARASGLDFPIYDEFPGGLSDLGETLTLIKPDPASNENIIVDRVRYEPQIPWSQTAQGTGASLQLIDASQDNSRVSNWTTAIDQGWIKATLSATNRSPRFFLYLTSIGDAYVDDVSLVGPDGRDLIVNGSFETPLSGTWQLGTNLIQSTIAPGIARSGRSSLHLISTAPFPVNGNTNHAVWQDVSPFSTNRYTLTFWYLPTTNAASVVARTLSSSPFLITRTLAPVYSTPGQVNNTANTLPPFDNIWLNEVQPYNITGPQDNQGDRDAWIELYNAGDSPVSLAQYYLSDQYSNLLAWRFPSTTIIPPRSFLLVWADGESDASSPTSLHTSFTLPLSSGSVALSRSVGNLNQVVDYLNYESVAPDKSYGSYPDGQPFNRGRFFEPTPNSTNVNTQPTVLINEWMADNGSAVPNPANQSYDDWFELYNPAETPADLSGFHLSDTTKNPKRFTIPPLTTIPPGGFLMVWADKSTTAHLPSPTELHVDFSLNKRGGTILLSTPEGQVIDQIQYSAQSENVSEGRFPDGANSQVRMPSYTPGSANKQDGNPNTAPKIEPIQDFSTPETARLQWIVRAADKETSSSNLVFTLEPGAPKGASLLPDGRFRWRISEDQGPGLFTLSIRVSDNGTPPLSDITTFTVQVTEVNSSPEIQIQSHYLQASRTLDFISGFDTDIPVQSLTFSLLSPAIPGLSLDPHSGRILWTPNASQAGTHSVTILAQDNGTPPLSTTRSFDIHVLNPNDELIVATISISDHQITLRSQAIAGQRYQILQSPSLFPASWTPVAPPITAQSAELSFQETISADHNRYYRIERLP